MSCIFCGIINKQDSADIVYEDEQFIAFRDINPDAPVHLLIVPKKHIPSVNDLKSKDTELVGKLILAAKKVAEQQNIADGYKLNFNVGRKGGQLVDHLHLHLMGGWSDK